MEPGAVTILKVEKDISQPPPAFEGRDGMRFERVTAGNLEYAVRVQEEIFPGESGRRNFEESLESEADYEYCLIYEGGGCAGVIGIYRYPEDASSAWLGWFGIRKPFRRRGLGSRALRAFEDSARRRGFRFARLYTDELNNEAAVAFYSANGYAPEKYDNPQDPACRKYRTLVFSKSLDGGELVPWNDRSIHLTEQIEKQGQV